MKDLYPLAQPMLQVLVLLGTVAVGYLHWRVESRLAKFREELMKTLNETFVNREVSNLQFQLLIEKLESLRTEVRVRLGAGDGQGR